MNIVLKVWQEHGTKLIGLLQVTAGAIATMDPEMVSAMLGPNSTRWIIMATGVLTAWRGFLNTDAIDRKDTDANAQRTS